MKTKAIFLDRDGVLIKPVFNPRTKEYEPPKHPRQIKILKYVPQSLKKLSDSGYLLFIVSNQSDYATGKIAVWEFLKVNMKFKELIDPDGSLFELFYYCFHHPDGVIPVLSRICKCRKPKPFFLFEAKRHYNIDLNKSWMIGDRDTDIQCGKSAGTNTILLEEKTSAKYRGKSEPNYNVKDLKEATDIILKRR